MQGHAPKKKGLAERSAHDIDPAVGGERSRMIYGRREEPDDSEEMKGDGGGAPHYSDG